MSGRNVSLGCVPVIDSGLAFSERGAAKAEDAQGTPTQSHTSLSILVYEEKFFTGTTILNGQRRSKPDYFADMCSGFKEGSYLRRTGLCIPQF
jgi:hypothetical protein